LHELAVQDLLCWTAYLFPDSLSMYIAFSNVVDPLKFIFITSGEFDEIIN